LAPAPIPTTAPSPTSARFLDELAVLFTEVLLVAQAMGLVKLGTLSLDGTKIKVSVRRTTWLRLYLQVVRFQILGQVQSKWVSFCSLLFGH
jgi:hypothetical protein